VTTTMGLSKADLARRLKVTPAYITMVFGGQRVLSRRLQKKVNRLGLTNEFGNMTLNQQVEGSIPSRLTSIRHRSYVVRLKPRHRQDCGILSLDRSQVAGFRGRWKQCT
jgi:hypothetical protein